jgi:hypothetical protein
MGYFKYIPFDRFESFRGGRIRFTQPGAFNDPFEMPAFKAAEAEAVRRGLSGLTAQTGEIQRGLTQGQIPDAAFIPPIYYFWGLAPTPAKKVAPSQQAVDKLKMIDEVFGILSLSMTADNLLLWAHYAAEHRGLAVEIDPTDREFKRHSVSDRNFELSDRVTYSSVRPKIPETDEILFKHFFVKSPEWAYEKEYRIVRHLKSSLETKAIKPFPAHLYELPASAIRKVIFGARVPAAQRNALIKETAADPAFGHLTFAEAVLDSGQFKVAIRDLPASPAQVLVDGDLLQALPVMHLPRE